MLGLSPGPAGEDTTCAEHLEALLLGRTPAPTLLDDARAAGLRRLHDPRIAIDYSAADIAAFVADIEACLQLDRFDFAMPVLREGGALVARPHPMR